MITRPVRERSHHRHRRDGREGPGGHRLRGGRPAVAVLAPTTPRSPTIAKGLADRYEGDKIGLSLPSTRVDAFNIDLANELTRNGRRSGLTFAPEGGSERIRKVINKMVTEEDLIRTVATAYGNGWRQVKLYFMCGLPTETDEDVLQIADMAKQVIADGPRGHRRRTTSAARCRSAASCPSRTPRSSGPPQLGAEETDARLAKLRDAIRGDKKYGRRRSASATTTASPASSRACSPAATAGSARSSARSTRTAAASTAGASTSRYDRWMRAAPSRRCADAAVDVDWYTTRERDLRRGPALGPPRLRPRQGLALGGLAGRARRDRGRGLPLDAVLRLRRVPADGHRDPDRPDRQEAAPADRRSTPDHGGRRPRCRACPGPTAGPPRHPLRQEGPGTCAGLVLADHLRPWDTLS